MNQSDLINSVAQTTGLSKQAAQHAVKSIFNSIKDELASGGAVQIIGFGTFSTKIRKERIGRHPSTGEQTLFPQAVIPRFKAGKTLKDSVNND